MSAPPIKKDAADREDLQREGMSQQASQRSQTRRLSAAERPQTEGGLH